MTNSYYVYQKEFMLSNPIRYLLIFLINVLFDAPSYLSSFVSGNGTICHNSVLIPVFITLIYGGVLILSFFLSSSDIELKKNQIVLIIFINLIIIFVIFTSLYLYYTSSIVGGVGSWLIIGVQGRYFFPLSFFLILIHTKIKFKNQGLLWVLTFFVNFFLVLKVFLTFL